MKPIIIKAKCPAQAMICKAIRACKNEAVKYIEDENEPLGGRIEIDYNKCEVCGTCAEECCGNAIVMAE
ncbi:MAG: hypothetical protein HPY74_20645 [Firmicutes bacterium]|nr:hypothetical protein [Bacillota bacterium]